MTILLCITWCASQCPVKPAHLISADCCADSTFSEYTGSLTFVLHSWTTNGHPERAFLSKTPNFWAWVDNWAKHFGGILGIYPSWHWESLVHSLSIWLFFYKKNLVFRPKTYKSLEIKHYNNFTVSLHWFLGWPSQQPSDDSDDSDDSLMTLW